MADSQCMTHTGWYQVTALGCDTAYQRHVINPAPSITPASTYTLTKNIPVIIMLHGWLTNATTFRAAVTALQNHSVNVTPSVVFAPDLPGFSNSQSQLAWPPNMEEYSRWLIRFIELNVPPGHPIHLVAEDTSCWMALYAGLHHPTLIQSTLLLNPILSELPLCQPLTRDKIIRFLKTQLPATLHRDQLANYIAPFDHKKNLDALALFYKVFSQEHGARKKLLTQLNRSQRLIKIVSSPYNNVMQYDLDTLRNEVHNFTITRLPGSDFSIPESHSDGLATHIVNQVSTER